MYVRDNAERIAGTYVCQEILYMQGRWFINKRNKVMGLLKGVGGIKERKKFKCAYFRAITSITMLKMLFVGTRE